MSFPLHFARYPEIAASVAMRLLAQRGDDPLQPWGEEVVAASGGVAESIARALIEKSGRPVVAGVALHPLETLARRILNEQGVFPRVASDAERRLAMRAAVRSISDPMMQTRGVASMLERSYRDMRDSGLTLDQFRRRSERVRVRNAARLSLVVRAWREYERLIALLGAIDPAELLTRAAAGAAMSAIPPQMIAGFYDMTGVQLALLESLDAAGKVSAVWVPAGEGDAYRFAAPLIGKLARLAEKRADHGGTSDELDPAALLPARLSIRKPEWKLAHHERRDVELRQVCERVAQLLAGGSSPMSIGIAARAFDDGDIHLVERFARDCGFTTTLAVETPLPTHRIARALITLLRLRDRGFPRADVIELIRDGLRVERRLDIDRIDVETRSRKVGGGTAAELRALPRRHFAVDDYIAVVAELEELTAPFANASLRGGEWSQTLRKLIARFHVDSELDIGAVEQLDAVADLFAEADRLKVRFDAAQVIDAIEQCTLRAAGAADLPRVWAGDVMRLRGRSFEHLFVVRLQDDSFPQRRVEDPLVPDADRRALQMREIGDGRDEEQLLFQLLFDSSKSLHFSYSASDGFGKMLRPSPLLKSFVIGEQPARKAELLKDFSRFGIADSQISAVKTATPVPRRALQLIARSGTRSAFDGYIADPVLQAHFASALQGVSPTQLEDFGECPQKFLHKHILGVRDIDDPQREIQINARDKGSSDHRILERFYRHLDAEALAEASVELPRLPATLAAKLDATIDAEFDELEETAPPFNRAIRTIERRATKRILRDFVVRDLADIIRTGLVPRHFEYRFGTKYLKRDGEVDHPEPFTVTAGGVPIRIDGSIDRIDSDGSKFRIVDYKSGKALRHKKLGEKIDRGVRLQLAVYAMAVAEFFSVDDNNVTATIKPLVFDNGGNTFEFGLAEKRPVLQETLDVFAHAILGGRFPAFPNERDFNSCKYCPVKHSCRTKHDAEESYAITRAGEARTLLQEES